MPLAIGVKLGPYEIIAPLGAGGMGEVYRARDTKLNREVALKVLPELFTGHAGRMSRFHREAQLLAALNHPNIASIYGLEESGGVRALVMELVEGPTLSERISAGAGLVPAEGTETAKGHPQGTALQFDEALRLARQIAEALEYAHERGIIHRDLKPANIKVTTEGVVKVLDFGLAKALDAESSPSELQNSPTQVMAEAMTGEGAILGTVGYMAPEQARGKPVDRRADIWAFGCVLYELLTARRIFKRDTLNETVAALLGAEVEWAALPAGIPPEISKLLRRCLQKDPRQRLQAIGDARITIDETLSGNVGAGLVPATAQSEDETGGGRPQGSALRRALPWAGAGIFLITTVILATQLWRASPVPVRSVRSYILAPENGTFAFEAVTGTAVLSPDGRRLVFGARDASGKQMLWLRELDSLSAQPLRGTEGGSIPFWSPDGQSIGFFVPGKLMRVDISGAPAQAICDAPNGRGGTWSPGGMIVFAPLPQDGLEQVMASGGSPVTLLPLDKSSQDSLRWPFFLPDGRHFLYWEGNFGKPGLSANTKNPDGIYIGALDSSDQKFLLPADSDAYYVAPGYVLFLKSDVLMAQPFDPGSLKITGEAFSIAEHVANPVNYRLGYFSASQNGDLIYEGGALAQDRVDRMDASGKQLGPVSEPGEIEDVRVSPDGRSLVEALGRGQFKSPDLWLVELAGGVRIRLTFVEASNSYPAWSPDGTKIAFSSNRSGPLSIYLKAANGAGMEEPLLEDSFIKRVTDWSRDGKYIAYERADYHGKGGTHIWVLPLFGDKKPIPITASRFNEYHGAFSPDGKWLAYTSDESGEANIYVAPFPGPGGKWQVSQGGGNQARWPGDGKALCFLAPGGKLMQAPISEKGPVVEVGAPRQVFQTLLGENTNESYDIAPNGKGFFVLTPDLSSRTAITLVTNWTAGLKK